MCEFLVGVIQPLMSYNTLNFVNHHFSMLKMGDMPVLPDQVMYT